MYKTIRHGENSLQYTILPQNDDIRMDGKLTSASSSSSNNSISNTGNCNRIKRNGVKNKSFYAYLGLLFVCTVIIGAILIPFLVSTDCLPNPSDWFLKTKITFSEHSNNNNNKINNKTNQIQKFNNSTTTTTTTLKIKSSLIDIDNNINNNQFTDSTINNAYPNENNIGLNDDIPTTITTPTTTSTTITTTTTTTTTTTRTNAATKIQNDFNNNYNNFIINKKILNKNNNNNNNIYKIDNDNTNNNDLLNDNNNNNNNKIEKNINKNSLINNNDILLLNQHEQSKEENIIANIKFDDIIHTTNSPKFDIIITTSFNDSNNNNNNIELTTEPTTINNNLKNSKKLLPPLPQIPVTKKPIILPVLAKTNSIIKENGIIISEHNKSKNWIKSHWPFIDPSTYFQWTGYKSEDSVLLPAILGITLIGIILILTLCLVARNKRIIVASVRKRNRNDIDETGEDNATLLTTANLSDADDE